MKKNAAAFIVILTFISALNIHSALADIRVNAGGGAYTDGSGNLWSADSGFNTGLTASVSNAIGGTTDDPLFRSERYDRDPTPELVYSFTVPDGSYVVNLLFAEIFSGAGSIGERVFDVYIEDRLEFGNVDIFSEVGLYAALTKSAFVTVADGRLDIRFEHIIENPKIAAIEVISQSDADAPTVPTGLSGTPGSTQVALAWSPSTDTGGSGLAGYFIYRNNVEVGSATTPAFNDSGRTPDTTYAYKVQAYDNAGNRSGFSNSIDVTTTAAGDTVAPTNPAGLSGTPGSTQVALAWSPSTDTGGSGLAGYFIYRNNVEVGSSTTPAYTDSGRTPNTTYAYKVQAYDNAGNRSGFSNSIDVTTTAAGGTAILRVNAGGGAYTDGSGNLWSADSGFNTGLTASVSNAIGGTTDDPLFRSERYDRDPTPELVYSFTVPDGSYVVNLLFAEIFSGAGSIGERVFDVYIEDRLEFGNVDIFSEVGIYAALTKSAFVTVVDGRLDIRFEHIIENPKIAAIEVISQSDADAPTVPTGLSGTPGSTQVALAWSPSTDTGGSGLAGYFIYRNNVEVGSSTTPAFTDSGRTPDTTYAYKVQAYDNAGNRSGFSNSIDVTTTAAGDTVAPTAPAGLSGTPGSTQVALAWSPSTDTGGSGLAGYFIYRNNVEVGSSTTPAYTDSGRTPNTTYAYKVQAYDNAGNRSGFSNSIDVTTTAAGDTVAPTNPAGLSGTPGSTQVALAWSPSTDTGGSGLAGYFIYRNNVEVGSSTTPAYTDSGRTPNTTYAYKVQAYDNAGNRSGFSNSIDVTTTAAGGTAILRVNAGGGAYTDGSGNLWSADSGFNTGLTASVSNAIGGTTDDPLFRSERYDRDPTPELVYSFAVPDGSYVVNLLFAEIFSGAGSIGERVFDVYIEDRLEFGNVDIFSEVGIYAALTKSAFVTVVDGRLDIRFEHIIENPKIAAIEVISQSDADAPTVPTGLSGTPGSTQVALAWSPSTDTGGSGLAGYFIYRNNVEVGSSTTPAFTDSGRTPDTTYAYKVQAYDNAGNRSGFSNSIDVTTTAAGDTVAPTAPAGLSGTPGSTQVALAWSPSTDTGGSGLAGYFIYRNNVEVGSSTTPAYTDSGRTPNTTYAYKVQAYDNAGNRSGFSNSIDVTTTAAGGTAILRVNAGGGAYTDGSGNLWSADSGFNTGLTASVSNAIGGTTDDPLFRSERYDRDPTPELVYSFAVPDGSYVVNLLFAEIFSGAGSIGERVFDVYIEDRLEFGNVDIFSEVGIYAALTKSAFVTVVDGRLDIRFEHIIENPKIAAIEVISASPVTLPISDDFEDGNLQGWNTLSDTGGPISWNVSGGLLYQQEYDTTDDSYHRGTYATLTALEISGITNYRFSVDVTPLTNSIGSSQGNDVGIMFRYKDANNYYRVSMSARYGFTRFEKRVGGAFQTLAVNARGYVDNQPMTMAAEVNGDAIVVWIDGDPVFALKDPNPIPSGTVALYCQDRVRFDNVLITETPLQPMVAIASPLAYSVLPGDLVDLDVTAVVLNKPAGGSVAFSLDGGSEIPVAGSGDLYSLVFTSVANGNHDVAAIVKYADGTEAGSDTNSMVGTGGDYYVTVGNSVTNGVGDFIASNNDSADGRIVSIQGYQARLADNLTTATGRPQIVFNEGIEGETADRLDLNIDSIMLRHPGANKVLMMIGTNDSGDGVTPDNFGSSVSNIANSIVADTKQVWLAEILPTNEDGDMNMLIQQYNTEIRGIVSLDENDDIFPGPDLYDAFDGMPGLYTDLLHPNDAGYQLMADEWAAKLP